VLARRKAPLQTDAIRRAVFARALIQSINSSFSQAA
jgi:hypothetical protein